VLVVVAPVASVDVNVRVAAVPVRNAVASATALLGDPANRANGAATRPATRIWPAASVGAVVVVPVGVVPVVMVPPPVLTVFTPPVVVVALLLPVAVVPVEVVVLVVPTVRRAEVAVVVVCGVEPGTSSVVCASTSPLQTSAAVSKCQRID
jgi:hypothetical protein